MRATFVREPAEVRRQALIEATARCMAEDGVGGTSVRAICAKAGVSSGLLTHYFEGIDALILVTYGEVARQVTSIREQAVSRAGEEPVDRLRAYLLSNFRPPLLDAELLGTWTAFWSLAQTSEEIAKAPGRIKDNARSKLASLLKDAAPALTEAEAHLAAISLGALVDGLWLDLCLDQSSCSSEEAQAIVEEAITQAMNT